MGAGTGLVRLPATAPNCGRFDPHRWSRSSTGLDGLSGARPAGGYPTEEQGYQEKEHAAGQTEDRRRSNPDGYRPFGEHDHNERYHHDNNKSVPAVTRIQPESVEHNCTVSTVLYKYCGLIRRPWEPVRSRGTVESAEHIRIVSEECRAGCGHPAWNRPLGRGGISDGSACLTSASARASRQSYRRETVQVTHTCAIS